MHSCLLSCSVLFLVLAVPSLNFGLWDVVPWPRIKLRPLALGAQSRSPWTKVPLQLASWVKLSCWQHSGSADPPGSLKLLCIFRNPWVPAFILETYRVVYNVETKTRHDSYLRLLSVDWGTGKKNKQTNKHQKLLCPVWSHQPGPRDVEWRIRPEVESWHSYHQGNKTCLDTFPSLFRFHFVFSSPSPFLGPVDQDVEAPVFRGPTPSVQDSRLFGGNLCLPLGGCSDIPPVR